MLPLIVILVALLALAGAYAWRHRPIDDIEEAAAGLPVALERARKLGLAVDAAGLRRLPPVAPEENAAPLYKQAADQWPTLVEDGKALTKLARTVAAGLESPEELADFRRTVSKLKAPLDLITEASWKPFCDLERPFERGASVEFTELAYLRQAAAVLTASAMLKTELLDLPKALETLGVVARVGAHVREDPTLLSMLVSCSIDTFVNGGCFRLAIGHYKSAQDLADIERFLAELPPLASPRHCFRSELVVGLKAMDDPEKLAEDARKLGHKLCLMGGPVASKAYKCRLLELWTEVGERSSSDPENLIELAALMRRVARDFHRRRELSYAPLKTYDPIFGRGVESVLRRQADRILVRSSVQLLRHWCEQGWLPLELEGRPRDPFTGAPIRYDRSTAGFRLQVSGGAGHGTEVIGSHILPSAPLVRQFYFPQR